MGGYMWDYFLVGRSDFLEYSLVACQPEDDHKTDK